MQFRLIVVSSTRAHAQQKAAKDDGCSSSKEGGGDGELSHLNCSRYSVRVGLERFAVRGEIPDCTRLGKLKSVIGALGAKSEMQGE